MKKLLITATIVSMLSAPFCAYAQDGAEARLSGVYQSYNDIKVIHNVENAESVAWYTSKTKDGTYNIIGGAESDTYKVKNGDAEQWIKAVVTDAEQNSYETEPRQIEAKWATRRGAEVIDGTPAETPSRYLFTVDGMDFILLDTTEDEESRFLVMTKRSVGKRHYSDKTNQSFANMAAFLNNLDTVEFYYNSDTPLESEEGYSESGYVGNGGFVQLPEAVFEAINKEQVWKTEPIMGGQARERCYKAGIVLPAFNDVVKYAERIGWKDDHKDKVPGEKEHKPEYVDFWLRTPSKSSNKDMLYASSSIIGGVQSKGLELNDNNQGLRLMFYLDKDFFIDNKVENPGQEVLNTLWEQYSKEELLKIYSQDELTALGYIDFAIEDFSIDKGEESSDANISIISRLSENKDIVVLIAVYDSEGMLIGANMDTVLCTEGLNEKTISLDGVTAENYSHAAAVILESAQNPAPIYKAAFIN